MRTLFFESQMAMTVLLGYNISMHTHVNIKDELRFDHE